MTDETPEDPKKTEPNALALGLPLGLPVGFVLGISLGLALDNPAIGISLGVSFGIAMSLAFGAGRVQQLKKKAEDEGTSSDEEKS